DGGVSRPPWRTVSASTDRRFSNAVTSAWSSLITAGAGRSSIECRSTAKPADSRPSSAPPAPARRRRCACPAGPSPRPGARAAFPPPPVAGAPPGVVVVFQDYSNALLQWRSIARNVSLGVEGHLDRGAVAQRVGEALQMVGLERNADDYPWQLSGGMQQRVQIARALALKPQVMLMDEPFGALDAMTKAALQDELLQVHARTGTSFVFITHDI